MVAAAGPFLEALRPAGRDCLWVSVALGKCSGQLRIVAIQVVIKMNLIISVSEGGPVNDEYRYALGEIHGDIVAAGLHGLLYARERPAGVVAQGPGRELGGLFDADTSMAEIAAGAWEELRRRRTVQIDVMLVGEHQLHQSESIFWPRFLPHRELASPQLRQHIVGNGSGGDDRATVSRYLVALIGNVVTISPDRGDDLTTQDARGY